MSNLLKPAQTCSNLFKIISNCQKPAQTVQTYLKLVKKPSQTQFTSVETKLPSKRGLYTGPPLLEIPGRNHLESTRILPDSYQESPGPGPSQIIRFSANLMISIPTRFLANQPGIPGLTRNSYQPGIW